MSQQTPIIGASQSGLQYRTQDNDGKQALLNHHKGSTAPSYTEAGCIWLDDAATPWLLKIHDGTDWITLAEVNATSNVVNALNHGTDISGKTDTAITASDEVIFSDASDSGNLKKDTVQGVIDVGAGVATEYSKTQNFNATTLTDAATIAWDAENNQVASVTLAGNRTLGAPTNLKDGATYLLIVKQDATGSRTLAYNAVYKFPGGTAPTLSTDANAVDILTFVSDGTNMYGVFQGAFVMFSFPTNHFSSSGGSIVKSIQEVQITIAASSTSNTASISSVDTNLSTVIFGGSTGSRTTSMNADHDCAAVELTNSTTVTAYRQVADANTVTVTATVIEWASWAVETVQTGVVTVTGSSGTASISSVTAINAAVIFNGYKTTYASYIPYNVFTSVELTNSTTVTAYRGTGSGTCYAYFTVIEFKSGVLNSSTQQKSVTVSNTTGTASITSVTPAQTMLFYGGHYSHAGSAGMKYQPYIELTNATTLTGSRNSNSATSQVIYATVVEFQAEHINAANRGTVTVSSGSSSGTGTFSAVDTAKSFANWLGHTTSTASQDLANDFSYLELTNSTTITATRNSTPSTTITNSYEVIEFI